MIKYNLLEKHTNKGDGNVHGVITANSRYGGYPVTIVDNHNEVVNGRYTQDPSLCLLHLSEHVRSYIKLTVFTDLLYLHPNRRGEEQYRMHPYTKVELSRQEIVDILTDTFYFIEPTLKSQSLVGSESKRIEDDPNYYVGSYILNDEELYTIMKCGTSYKFFKGEKKFYPDWKKEEDLLFSGEINFDVYKDCLELFELKRKIVVYTNQVLDKGDFALVDNYRSLREKVNHYQSSGIVKNTL